MLEFSLQVNLCQQRQRCFGTGLGSKAARAVNCHVFAVLTFREYLLVFQLRILRIRYDPGYEVHNLFQLLWCNIQQQCHTAWNTAQIPDVRNRSRKLNMSHTLTTNAGFCNFYTTTVTYNTLVAYLLIFSTVAFPVLARPENSFTEQSISFRLLRTVVDRLWFLYFTMTPFVDSIR